MPPPPARSVSLALPAPLAMATLLVSASVAGCTDFTHFDAAPSASALRTVLDENHGIPTDVAIILGCPGEADGSASPCQRCRVESAVAAFRRGEVRAVIFSGAAVWSPYTEAGSMSRLAIQQGLPPEAVLLEPRALTTWMNLRDSQRLMRQLGYRAALVISAANHLPRARRFVDFFGIPARYRACDGPDPVSSSASSAGIGPGAPSAAARPASISAM